MGFGQQPDRHRLIYIPEKAQVLYKIKYNDYFGENIQLFTAINFIARLYRRAHSVHSPETQTSDTLLRSVFQQDKGEGR